MNKEFHYHGQVAVVLEGENTFWTLTGKEVVTVTPTYRWVTSHHPISDYLSIRPPSVFYIFCICKILYNFPK